MSSYELRDTLACTFRITYFLSLGDIRYLRVDRTTPDCPKPFPLNFHTAREDEDRETKGEKTDRQIFFFFFLDSLREIVSRRETFERKHRENSKVLL